MVTVKDKAFRPFLDQTTVETRIRELGQQISHDYAGRQPLLVAVLNGAFLFAAELMKGIDMPCEITFVRVTSYEKMGSTGQVKAILGLTEAIENRDLIIVEDIVDTGLTMTELLGQLTALKPRSLEIATLLHKPEATRVPLRLRYVGFEIEDKFVVGYGLDYDGLGRNLAGIYQLSV